MSSKHGVGEKLQQPAPRNAGDGRGGSGLHQRRVEVAAVATVIALVLAACWPAISVSFGYSGNAMAAGDATPAATASMAPAQPTPTSQRPTSGTSRFPEPVDLDAPTVIHATGAALRWPSYVNITPDPANDLAAYEVHRDMRSDFTPSSATLVAKVSAHRNSFVDTTASASSRPRAGEYFYMVAVRTRAGQLISGPTRFVQLPKPGQTEVVLPVAATATLNAGYPNTVFHDPGLSVSPDLDGNGAERTILGFGPLKAIPSGAVVAEARLNLWCNGTADGPFRVYTLTRRFDGTQATWNSAANGRAWSHPGGDYTTPAGITLPVDAADPDLCEFDVTGLARKWTNLRGAEHGLLLKALNETTSAGYGGFSAGDTDSPDQLPQLAVTYVSR